jgi:prepilin-type N-terminal cleavage/methylation domain-containing protein
MAAKFFRGLYRLISRRLSLGGRDAGFTMVEMLVASAMGVIVVGATGTLVVSAMKRQPEISKRAQTITTARWVLERMTREIRNGKQIELGASQSSFSLITLVRRSTCGGAGLPAAGTPAIECRVTYSCTATTCSRTEAAPGSLAGSGTKATLFTGINSENVFSYAPNAEAPTYVRITLRMPNPRGGGSLKVSDGASLRNATLSY